MNKFRNLIFAIFGVISFILMIFSMYIILILLAIITHYYITISIIGIILTIIDFYRNYYFKKKGLQPKIGRYEKLV